jgi:hypothetical protein
LRSGCRDAKDAIANGDVAVAVGGDKANATWASRGERTIVVEMTGIMGCRGLCSIIEMCTGSSKRIGKDGSMEVEHFRLGPGENPNYKGGAGAAGGDL